MHTSLTNLKHLISARSETKISEVLKQLISQDSDNNTISDIAKENLNLDKKCKWQSYAST
jgi:hypothetical protein